MIYWRGILSSESLYETFNGKNLFSLCLVNANIFPNQLAGLGDERDCIHDILNIDLIYLTISPGVHPGGEFYEYYCLFTGLDWVKVWLCSTLLAFIVPAKPIILPSPVSFCSEYIITWYPHKHEITCDANFSGILYSFHDWLWGRGKLELK